MGIDASIPLQTRVFKPKSGVESYGEAMKLKNLAGQQRLQDMQMTQAKQGMADTATLREVALGANGDIDKYLADPRTLATDPTGTMKLRGDRTAQQMKQELDELTLTDKRYERTNQLLSSTFDQPSHDIAIQQALDEEIMTQDQAIQVAQYSDEQRDRFLGQTEQGRAELKRQFEQTKFEYKKEQDKLKPPWKGAIKDANDNWVMDPNYISGQTQIEAAGKPVTKNIFNAGEKLSPGWEQIDKKFADTYSDFMLSGGYADAEKQIGQLTGVTEALQQAIATGGNLTGPLLALMPNVAKTFTNPESINVKEAVEEVVQRNLRVVLGAQFTEKEGERLISRAYNPALNEEKNLERVQNLLGAMTAAYNAKMSAVAHFEEKGTMKGYRGRRADAFSVYKTIGATDLLDSAGNPKKEESKENEEDELIY